jgi:WXXGXW repeat (2 copies)
MSDLLKRSTLAALVVGLLLGSALLTAKQPPVAPAPAAVAAAGAPVGVEELTRGPVHEAFGRPVVFDPQPGPVAPKEPPAPVEEIPPDETPAGENVAWIPGYWAWDDDQTQFVWVSGFWRELPPARAWVSGYWSRSDRGAQWVSGYWAAAATADAAPEVEYLPEPPASLEAGPPGAAPADDRIWVPGLWTWQTNRYAWRPGFWAAGSADWVWTPAHYQWSPVGYAYVAGFWDYPLWRRGLLFAPVTFGGGVGPGFAYTPRLALNTAYLGYAMFTRPQTGSYYFGDYYAPNYLQSGYYPWFAFHNTRYGYDPLFAHADWVYARQNIDWEARLRQVYYERRDDPAARPSRLYRDYARGTADRGDTALVRPLAEMRTVRDLPFKMERLDAARASAIQQHTRAVRDFGTQRARLEGQRVTQPGPGALAPARGPVAVRLPAAPRFTGVTAARPPGPRALPEPPAQPQPDLTRKPEPRPPHLQTPTPQPRPAGTPPQPPPKTEARPPQPQPQVRTAATLPHPEQVLRPDFNRRAGPVPTPPGPAAQPPARPNPPIQLPARPNPPPAAHPALPPINGAPHPGHVAPPALHPAPPPAKRPPL